MRATALEFRLRFWLLGALFGLGYASYAVDHRNSAAAIVRTLAPGADVATGIVELLAAATLLAAAGALLRTWASAYLSPDVVHDTRLHRDRLVADGPFRHVRNPLYLGLQIVAVGLALAASRVGFWVIVLGVGWFHLRLIGREEAELEAQQGEDFRAYAAAVPRLLPSLAPRLPDAGGRPRWGRAVLGELFVWILVVALAAFAVTLDFDVFGATCMGGMVLYWPLTWIQRRALRPGRREPGPAAPSTIGGELP
jgi:protein-S-isoprenylcysteine O-methyltransferase Ste14